MTHCHSTMAKAHFLPNSLFTDAIAATQGVYNKENTKSVSAPPTERTVSIPSVNRISIVDTTLSFAINPLISEVTIRQSPSPRGWNKNTSQPDTYDRILSEESSAREKLGVKLCKNHTTIVAISIIEKVIDYLPKEKSRL